MPSKTSSSAKMMDSDEFRDKLKNMGKTSKKKFAQMAAMFSRRKNSAKHFLGHAAGAPSKVWQYRLWSFQGRNKKLERF
jgi:hypothetical protein